MHLRSTFILLSFFFFTSFPSLAQETETYASKLSLGTTLGLSFPLDEYKNNYSEIAYPLHTGFQWKAEGTLLLCHPWGIHLSVGSFTNPLSKESTAALYLQDHRTMAYKNQSGQWRSIFFLAGPDFRLGTSRHLFDLSLSAGLLLSRSPGLTRIYTSYYNADGIQIDPTLDKPFVFSTSDSTISTPGQSSAALAFAAGVNYTFMISTKLGVTASLQGIIASPSVDGNNRTISTLNAGTGLRYFFK